MRLPNEPKNKEWRPKKSVRRRWDTKELQRQRKARDDLDAVHTWWHQRLQARKIFALEGYEEDEDYIGRLPWPEYVSLNAVYRDFVHSTGHTLDKRHFATAFRRAARIDVNQNLGQNKKTVYFVTRTMYNISGKLMRELTEGNAA